MQVTILKKEDFNFEARVVIPQSEIENIIDKEILAISKKAKVAGFRVGKVPISILNKKYRDSVRYDVVNKEINRAIDQIVKENDLKVLVDPVISELENSEGKDLAFTLKVELMPNIEIPNFKKITILFPKLVVQESEIDEKLESLATYSKKYTKEIVGAIETGHQATIDATGYIDNEPFDGGSVKDYKLVIGSGSFIHGFEDKMVGAKAGDYIKLDLQFPEDYHMKHVAGKPVIFEVHVKEVKEAEPVSIDDAFAKQFNSDTLEELKSLIAKRLIHDLDPNIRILMKMSLFNQLENILSFDLPESLVKKELSILKTHTNSAENDSELFKDKTKEEIEDYYNKLALRRVRVGLMLNEYARIRNIKVNESDLQHALMQEAQAYPGQEMMVYDYYRKNPKALSHLRGPILENKTVQYIFDNEVTLETKEYTIDELNKLIDQEEDKLS